MPELHDLLQRAAQQPTRRANVDAMWRRGRQMRRRRRAISTALVTACLVAFGGTLALVTDRSNPQTLDVIAPPSTTPSATTSTLPTRQPTKGPLVNDTNGQTDWAASPDYIPALGNDGQTIVGYIRKNDLQPYPPGTLPPGVQPGRGPLEVFDETLTKLVGHHVPGVGFVPLGETPPPTRNPQQCAYLGPDGKWVEDTCTR